MDVERGVYDTNNQPKRATFKYEQEGRFFIGVAKVESKEYESITGKRCPVLDYTGKEHFHRGCIQKINPKLIRTDKEVYFVVLTMGKNMKTDKIWLCESVGKLKGIGNQGEEKMNEMNIQTIDGLQSCVQSYGLPKLPIRGFV